MEYKVGDYIFEDEATAEKARKEAETISYIRSRTDFSKPENAKRIINTIKNNNMFETELGLDFLAKLERFAEGSTTSLEKATPPVKNEEAPIAEADELPAFTKDEEDRLREEVRRRTKHLKDNCEERIERIGNAYKAKARNLGIVIGALAAMIIALLIFTYFSDASPFYDAEREVLNKYASWQEELTIKEQQLTEWEKELKAREDKLNGN